MISIVKSTMGSNLNGTTIMSLRKRVDHFNRDDPLHVYWWKGRVTNPPQPYPGTTSHSDYLQTASATQELLVTEGHPVQQLGKSKSDIGGPFLCVRRELEEAPSAVRHYRGGTVPSELEWNFLGSYHADAEIVTDNNFPAAVMPDAAEMLALGTTAIARVIPTNPLNSLVTTLGELRAEGLPAAIGSQTWRQRSLNSRNAGSEYLNVEFGWRPLVNEIRSLCNTVRRADELIKRYERGAGVLIKRSYGFPVITSRIDKVTADWPRPYQIIGMWQGMGVKTVSTYTRTTTWFEGAFTYHMPKGLGGGYAAKANHLYGTRLTPEVLWNLTPWSWAIDWFTNLGDIVHNLSAFLSDGLAMPYAYIMRERMVEKRVTLTNQKTKSFGPLEPLEQVFTTTVKARLGATPFGFGLDQSDLSDRQLAIIGALGLSRGSNSSARFD